MATLKIFGDTISIVSELTKEELERAENFAPETLKLKDDEGNEIFGIGFGAPSYSKYGITFCSEDASGHLFMTMNNPVLDHSDVEAERATITKVFAQTIHALNAIEFAIMQANEALSEMEEAVVNSIQFC